jgi:hypothetical protein
MRRILTTLCAALVLNGCTPTGPDNTTDLTWTMRNGCSNSIDLKFFDRTNGGAWPNAAQVYVLDRGEEKEYRLECRVDAQICYGASLRSNHNFYWGVSAANDQGCQGCCRTCGRTDPTPISLDCN